MLSVVESLPWLPFCLKHGFAPLAHTCICHAPSVTHGCSRRCSVAGSEEEQVCLCVLVRLRVPWLCRQLRVHAPPSGWSWGTGQAVQDVVWGLPSQGAGVGPLAVCIPQPGCNRLRR